MYTPDLYVLVFISAAIWSVVALVLLFNGFYVLALYIIVCVAGAVAIGYKLKNGN